MPYTYMVLCSDNTLYTGWTTDLEKRVEKHNKGLGAKYTRVRLPVKLMYWEYKESKSEAMKREVAIKRYNRKQKEVLIEKFQEDIQTKEIITEK